MRIGVSGAHGTGKTSLVASLSERLPDHETVPEPYESLEEEGYEFGFPPTAEDYRAQLVRAIAALQIPSQHLIFDRTPLDFLAYLQAIGCPAEDEASTDALAPLFARLDVLIILPVTAEVANHLPSPEFPALRDAVNDALLTLAYDDPLDAWAQVPILALDGPVDGRASLALQRLQALHPSGDADVTSRG